MQSVRIPVKIMREIANCLDTKDGKEWDVVILVEDHKAQSVGGLTSPMREFSEPLTK